MSKLDTKRWYRYRGHRKWGKTPWQYAYVTRADAVELADDQNDGIRGYTLRAIKRPPVIWLERELDRAMDREVAAKSYVRRVSHELVKATAPRVVEVKSPNLRVMKSNPKKARWRLTAGPPSSHTSHHDQ